MDEVKKTEEEQTSEREEVAELDILQLAFRQLLIARDASETGLALLQVALRQGPEGAYEGTEDLEEILKKAQPPKTFNAKKED